MSTLSAAITASASALNVERARIEVAVSNMANADSTRSADGQPYRRRDVMLTADPVEQLRRRARQGQRHRREGRRHRRGPDALPQAL